MYLSENYLLMNEWDSKKNKELKLEKITIIMVL